MKKKILLTVLVVAIVGIIVYLEMLKPHQSPTVTVLQTIENATSTDTGVILSPTGTPAVSATSSLQAPKQFISARAATIQKEAQQYQSAPELAGSGGFINSQPFKLSSFVGNKVVLLDFWTYSCINCVRTIPYLNAWYQKYKDAGLVIVGVSSPEFDFEHDYNNVAAAVKQLGIQYPVVLDNNLGTWNAYQNLYWPHEYLINVDGFIVHDNIGEGNYDDTEQAIQAALMQRAIALGLPTSTVPTGLISPSIAATQSTDFNGIQTPETYFGAARNGYLANGPAMNNGVYALTLPAATTPDGLYLTGTWDFQDQYATNQSANAQIIYSYSAKNVYMVASADKPVTVQVFVDGTLSKTITIQANQLYTIVNGSSYGSHALKLIIQNAGLKAYTFTFG